MLLSTQTHVLSCSFGTVNAVEMLSAAGFDSLDYSMFCMSKDDCILNGDDFKEYVKKVKSAADRNSIRFTQAHAPFSFEMKTSEKEHVEFVKKRIIRAMEIASMLEVPIMIVHPMQFRKYSKHGSPKFFKKANCEFYGDLIPFSEKYGVKIACENMWQYNHRKKRIVDSVCADPQEFIYYIDSQNSPNMVACMDLGHCELTGRKTADCIRAMGSRIQALHVHDNYGVNDDHLLPGYGKLDWDEIMKALAEINYRGNLTFEADNFLMPYVNDRDGAVKALTLMEHVGRTLIGKFENYKLCV